MTEPLTHDQVLGSNFRQAWGLFQTLEAQTFQRRFLRVTEARFDLALAIGIFNAASHGHRAVVREHISIDEMRAGSSKAGTTPSRTLSSVRRCEWRRPAGERLVLATRLGTESR